MNYKIPSPPKVKLDIVEFTYNYIEYEPYFYLDDSDYPEDIEKAYIYINGKKYKAKGGGYFDAFSLEYSAKVGSTMKIVIIDEEDNEYELVYKVPHTLSEIHLNKVESGSWKSGEIIMGGTGNNGFSPAEEVCYSFMCRMER